MFGYILVVFLMTGWYFLLRSENNNASHKNFLMGVALIMTLFYGLRGPMVGSDTVSYISMFKQDGNQELSNLWAYMWEQKSPAYVLAEWVFYRVFPNPQLWLIATSAFFFFTFSKFLEKNSEDPYFSYFIFFTIFGTFQMTGVRQSCAMAVLMMAFEQIKKKKLVKYLLLVGLAYLFHQSAMVFLPFYFIGKRRITNVDIPILAVALVMVYQNRSFLFDYIKSFTSYDYFEQLNHGEPINFSIMIYGATALALVLCGVLTSRKRRQLSDQYMREHNTHNSAVGVGIRTRQTIPSSVLNLEIRKDSELLLYMQYANAMLLASLFMPLVAVNGAVRRIVMYFALYMVLLIPKAFREFMEPQTQWFAKVAVGSVLLYLLLSGVSGSSYEYFLFF